MLTVHVLGPVEARRDGRAIDLGGPQQRAVLAHLALEAGRVVSVDRLIDRLWGDAPPRTPLGTLQSYVSRLRRALEPERAAGAVPQVLVSEAPGYALRLPDDRVDLHRFRALVGESREHTATGRYVEALAVMDEALALWRGPAFAGVGPDDQVRGIVARLDEERESVVEDRFDTLVALGRHGDVVAAIQSAVDERPLRERRWALLALALYRSSRQAEALRALSTARSTLRDELGLDPGPELRALESRILAHDPTLAPAPTAAAAPNPATVPLGQTTLAAPAGGPSDVLVERPQEWHALHGALEAAGAGHPQLVLVEGEPGIGKSTLCESFLAGAAATGWRTAVGRCLEPGLAPSLWPCIEIVRAIVDTTEAPAPDVVDNPLRRLVASGQHAGVALTPVELADQFVALLDTAAGGPWLFLLDDLHWADRATLDVARLVLERLGHRRVMVVGAHRPPAGERSSLLREELGGLRRAASATTRIRVSPLDTQGVAQLIELTTGVAPSSELADRVRRRAGGNPLFVAELARLAGERGLDETSAVPAAIRDVVRGRLAALPEQAIAELEVAAVLGERFDVPTALAASERDPDGCLDALDAAIVTRILVPDADGFRFAHALVRDAVVAEISPMRLMRLHHRAAEAILATRGSGPDEAEPIAHHRLAAASFSDAVTVAKSVVRAADVARWRGALDVADELADRALEVLAGAPRTPATSAVEMEALESIVSAAYRRNDPGSVAAAASRVQEFAKASGSDAASALALFLHWGDIDDTEDLAGIGEVLDEARALVQRTTDPYAVVTAGYIISAYELLRGHIDEAAEYAERAIAAWGPSDPDTRPEHVPLVQLPLVAAIVASVRGDDRVAAEHIRRLAAWMSQRNEVDATAAVALAFSRAFVHALLGDAAAARDALDVIPSAEPSEFVARERALAELLRAWAGVHLGEPGALGEAFATMGELEAGELTLRSCLRTFLADACLAAGDSRAVDLLREARAEATSRGELWWLAETIRLQAVAERRFGDPARADELLDEAAALAARQGAGVVTRRIAASRATT